ncbi:MULTISPECIES: hypothetical protein [Cyanophyceae]|uniref:hypothetical protein n=2 Tax=Cyanobacteriota TaxID=1117 RepID=UPI00016DC4D7|nr:MULTISPECIES: hypothetical protein [Cyanophyceae]ACA98952.1 conserved hypothetical protein [Picosynechococcus sp. PCC 7002]SMH36550.1 hypothetical protein SAMN06272755_0775 [Picosynechococcus sp. OG1]SMQ77726.1 hypothetical protein SAMN06272774_0054 [Synechococcus sp. 7002]
MSQADPQASLSRLKQTLAQLQQVVADLETGTSQIPTAALDTLSTDTENLIRQLQQQPEAAINPVVEVPANTPGVEVPTTPVPKVKPRRVEPVPQRPRRKPWWQQQKLWLGAATAAIAFIFLWKFTAQTPQLSEDIAQSPPTEPTEEVAPETSQPETPTQAPKVSEPAPAASAEPPKPLTPEQRLIAAIQAQLDEVTQPYGDNIVRTIQADFDTNTLRITVGDAWYLLREGLQDRLGMEVLELAQLLDFKKMVVEDLAGNFVARNPVVGDRLVIVRRYQDFQGAS